MLGQFPMKMRRKELNLACILLENKRAPNKTGASFNELARAFKKFLLAAMYRSASELDLRSGIS